MGIIKPLVSCNSNSSCKQVEAKHVLKHCIFNSYFNYIFLIYITCFGNMSFEKGKKSRPTNKNKRKPPPAPPCSFYSIRHQTCLTSELSVIELSTIRVLFPEAMHRGTSEGRQQGTHKSLKTYCAYHGNREALSHPS